MPREKKSVTFFGNQYSNEGVRPDPEKVRDIQKMPTPQNKEELHSFIGGLMQYLSQFTPNFADRAHHLRELLKQDVPWVWEPSHQKCFEELKTAVTKPICLKYYDTTKSLSLEVDASQKGLGAALVQDGKPIAFGSKTLTKCQSRYSNMEREMLVVVWGIERYHTYLYGRAFTVVSDHKPLEIICGKPLRSAPPRLQRMLTKIQGYDFKVTYRPGKDMLLADTLSRLPNPDNNEEVQLDLKVDAVTGPQDDEIVDIGPVDAFAGQASGLLNSLMSLMKLCEDVLLKSFRNYDSSPFAHNSGLNNKLIPCGPVWPEVCWELFDWVRPAHVDNRHQFTQYWIFLCLLD